MSETSLSSLVKEIGEALVLDDSNHDKAAYKKYVTCIYKIATNLILAMRQAGGDVVVDGKTSKQVKLVQQCVERVISLLEKMESSVSKLTTSVFTYPSAAVMPTSDQSVIYPSSLEMGFKPDSPISPHQQQPMSMVQSNQSSGPADRFKNSVPSLVVQNNPHAYSAYKSNSLTPMEIAKKQNQSLMAAYKARMERLNRSDFNAFNYSLTIQRKMAENIAIARAQEEELAKKMQARNLRLEKEAAKRFATPMGMSKEEQEQRQIYKKILEYENEANWLKIWRSRLEARPEDPILINQLVQEILRCSDHPFTELLHKFQFQIYQRLYPLVTNKHEEIDMVTVPLSQCAWPAIEDVVDVFSECPHPPISQERINLSEDIKYKTSVSGLREEDNTEKKTENIESEISDVYQGEDDMQVKEKALHSQIQDENVKLTDDSKRKPKLSVIRSKKVDADFWQDPLCVRTKSQDSQLFQGEKHEQAAADSREHDDGIVEEKGSAEKFGETHVSNHIIEQINNVYDEHENKTLENKTYNNEGVMAQNGDNGSVTVSNQVSCNTESSGDRRNGGFSGEAVIIRADHLAVDKVKELESQVSWERRQAQILMRQVTRDYNSYSLGLSDYDENNLDYLFDDDENDYEGCAWFTNYDSLQSGQENYFPPRITPSLDCISSPELLLDGQGPSLDRSVSHTPVTTRVRSQSDYTDQYQSLPTSFGQESKSHEDKEFEKLSQDAYQRHLKSISDDIHRYLEKLLVMMTIAYEPLDTPIGKDQCAVSLEEPFFKPVWKTLLRLFRVVNRKQELVLAAVMTRHADSTPEDFKVSNKLWLTDAACKPYQRAITELSNVKEHYTMLNKLECVVKVCRLICECVDEYYKRKDSSGASKKAPSLGADDLLPILCYVVIQSAMPQLSAECDAMTEFIHEGYRKDQLQETCASYRKN